MLNALAVCQARQGLPVDFFCSGIQFYLLLCPYLCFISFLYEGCSGKTWTLQIYQTLMSQNRSEK